MRKGGDPTEIASNMVVTIHGSHGRLPFMAATVDRVLGECEICARYNIRRVFTAPLAHIPPPDGPFRHLTLDYIDMGAQSRVRRMRYVLVVICGYS